MPRPAQMPAKLLVEATIRPGQGAQMRTEEDRNVPVKLFCTERKVTDFKIIAHADEYITVEGGGYRYRIGWSNAEFSWTAGEPAPQRVNVPHWCAIGRSIRYIADQPLRLTAVGPDPVILRSMKFSGRFHVVAIFARHVEVSIDGCVGRFRIELDDNFAVLWAQATDTHNDRIKPAKFIERGRRIMPIDAEGNRVGTTSYVVEAYDQTGIPGGVMRIAPLLGEGVSGPPIDFPTWNSTEMWAIAPDDISQQQVEPGMTVRHGDEEYEVVAVDPLTKRIEVERKQRSTFRLGDPTVEIVQPENPQPESQTNRFTRVAEGDAG